MAKPVPTFCPDAERDRLIRIGEVCEITGLGRTLVYKLTRLGKFPQPVRISTRAVRWSERQVRRWIADRIAARDAG